MTYVQTAQTFEAALWDGVDPDPVDSLMVDILGTEYLGYSVSSGVLTLTVTTGSNWIWGFWGDSRSLNSGDYLVVGPLRGGELHHDVLGTYGGAVPVPTNRFEILYTEA